MQQSERVQLLEVTTLSLDRYPYRPCCLPKIASRSAVLDSSALPVCRGRLRCAVAPGQVSLALRSVSRGAPPPVPFAVVASVSTAVLLIGWRAAFAAFSSRSVVRHRAMQPTQLHGCCKVVPDAALAISA